MTAIRQGYRDALTLFVAAIHDLEEVQEVFIDTLTSEDWDTMRETDEYGLARRLDERGSWLTGPEYLRICDAISTLEALAGRAAARAV